MRHRKAGRRFGRTSSHRQAMFINLSKSLIEHEVIKTTVAKAKDLRRVFERMITAAKNDTVAERRLAFAKLRDKELVHKLFADLGVRFNSRPGGYVRILKCGYRVNDRAPMAYVELVERESVLKAKEEEKPKKKTSAKAPKVEEQASSSATA